MKKFDYRVSVIVPVYNSEEYLVECIESVINQSISFDEIQVILVNDGSNDDSLSICNSYSEKYENIVVIDQKNKGVSAARNNGIKASSGKYIMLLDSDDVISSNTINDLLTFFENNYNKIEIITYPICYLKGKSVLLNERYKQYDKGTGIYDINDYIYLNQSNINIMFKNNKESPLYFNEKMKLAEDQCFCTELIMRKEKIGYVATAKYIYRKHGGGASDLRNNPYYCYDYIMDYNEGLLKKYPNNKYIQTLVMNTLNWRLNVDNLFPYHLDKKEYGKEINRIKKLINMIDVDIIMNNPTIKIDKKIFFLRFSEKKFKINNSHKIVEGNNEVLDLNDLCGQVYRMRINNKKLYIYGSFCLPLENSKLKLKIKKKYKNDKLVSEVKLKAINLLHYNFDYNNDYLLSFEEEINLVDLINFEFYVVINNNEYKLNFEFERFSAFDFVNNSFRIKYDFNKKKFFVSKSNFISRISSYLNFETFVFKKRPKASIYRFMSRFLYRYKNIWLYTDNCHALNNAYYQFKHDFVKKDRVKKFYIYSKGINVNEFTEEEKKYLVKYGSIKHKMLFLNSKKIITSFSDLQVYCPFDNAIRFYKDIANYELIYLQHGILHASLKNLYLKRLTEIDKFVISSNFEKENLIKNYNYSLNNLLETGMPRMNDVKINTNVKKDTILFAPSWRTYLIGNSVNIKRELKVNDFVNSEYFKNMYNFLHSKELKKYLDDNNLKFVFKLHPNFYDYLKYFELEKIDYIKTSDDGDYNKYCLFITDFSSFQFDFIKLSIPTIYFLPDEKKFKAGLHSYRELDLKYEDAFGKLCKNDKELLIEMNRIKANKFIIDKVYSDRINKFFLKLGNSKDDIYKYLINNK